MMGLMLHANGKALIRREQYKEAREVLTMGEVGIQNLLTEISLEQPLSFWFRIEIELLPYSCVLNYNNDLLLIHFLATI